MTKRRKNTAGNFLKSFFDTNLQFTYPWASVKDVQATREAFSPHREYPAVLKIKFINFLLFLGVIFALLDPDLDYESGSRDPFESGSNPDPQHCNNLKSCPRNMQWPNITY
jgi:hypothetical protein